MSGIYRDIVLMFLRRINGDSGKPFSVLEPKEVFILIMGRVPMKTDPDVFPEKFYVKYIHFY